MRALTWKLRALVMRRSFWTTYALGLADGLIVALLVTWWQR